MEEERFEFSPLRPILFVINVPLFYYWLTHGIAIAVLIHKPMFWVMTVFCILIIQKLVRITFLMLALRPALVLSNASVPITASGSTIKWTDVSNVYLSSRDGDSSIPVKSYFVTITVREADRKAYLMQLRNPFTRWYRWATRNWRTSFFEVDLSLVRGNNEELLHTILRYYQNNRGF